MDNYSEEFQKRQEVLIKYKDTLEENLKKAIDKYKSIEESDIDRKETRLQIAQKTITTRKNALQQVQDKILFFRPPNEKDMEYRLRQYDEFSKKMEKLIPDNLPLRFHGCPIYTAKHILESGEISSSVDRLGVETSYDVSDQVSVTTKNTLETTIHGYSDLTENYLPAGCVFVMLPRDEQDAQAGDSMLMGNVDFKAEPNRLYGIITTPENIENVSQWAQKCGIDLEKIYDFDNFAKTFEKEKENIGEEKKDGSILQSAVEATKLETRTSSINMQSQNIRNVQKERAEKENNLDDNIIR